MIERNGKYIVILDLFFSLDANKINLFVIIFYGVR